VTGDQSDSVLHVSPTAISHSQSARNRSNLLTPNFDQRRFLRELSRPQEEGPAMALEALNNPSLPMSQRRVQSARDLLRSLTEPRVAPGSSSPPSPPVPSLYSPVPGLLSRPAVGPRFEPQHGLEVGDRIDRILELSRRTRVLSQGLERKSLPRFGDPQVTDAAGIVRPGGPVTSRLALGGEATHAEETPRPPKRSRTDLVQFEADLEEAVRRSIREQRPDISAPYAVCSRAHPDVSKPGCSHWSTSQTEDVPGSASTVKPPPTASDAASPPSPAASIPVAPTPASPKVDFEARYKELYKSHRKLVENLQSTLECPVCMETIRTAPVPCCRNGHLICGSCVQRTFTCPTCRAPMTAQRCVSHSANRLIDLLPHPCTNKDNGCSIEELLVDLSAHEQKCKYRQVQCPYPHCLVFTPLAKIGVHLSSCHPTALPSVKAPSTGPLVLHRYITSRMTLAGTPDEFQLRSLAPIRFQNYDKTFYLQTIASPDSRHLYTFLQAECNREECDRFWATITVSSFNPYTVSQVKQTIRPTPLDLHCKDDLLGIGEAVVLTERTVLSVLQYHSDEKRYEFKVEVEVKEDDGWI